MLSPLNPPTLKPVQFERIAQISRQPRLLQNDTALFSASLSPQFSGFFGAHRGLVAKVLIALGIIGVPGSTYLGLNHMKESLRQPVKEHSKKAIDQTGKLMRQDIDDLKGDMQQVQLVHMDAVMKDAKTLAKDQALAYKKQMVEKFTSLKGLSSLWGKDKNVKEVEKMVDALSVEDLEKLEKGLNEDKPSLETVRRFKEDLDALTKKRLANSHINKENYEPIIDAAFEDISTVIVRSGVATATGVATSMTMFILGMVLYIREKKQQPVPPQA